MHLFRILTAATLALGISSFALAGDAPVVEVENPYARAVPPTAGNSAAFMTLHNRGSADLVLVGAVSDVSEITELHDHINDNGVMRMRRVPQIDLPAGSSTELKPGSLHVMLIGLKQPLQDGDAVNVTLQFDNGQKQTVSMHAQKMMMMQGHQHMQH